MMYVVRSLKQMTREREREREIFCYMRFIDPRKVYNLVDHTLLWNVLVR